jgi:hypothetical protein
MFVVFLNSPYRETPKKRTKKKVKKKKPGGGWVGLGFSKCTGGSVKNKIAGPSPAGTQIWCPIQTDLAAIC